MLQRSGEISNFCSNKDSNFTLQYYFPSRREKIPFGENLFLANHAKSIFTQPCEWENKKMLPP